MMFNKKQIISVIIFAAIWVTMCYSIHAETVPTISVENVTAVAGDTVAIPIKISGNTGICGATISISYDRLLVLTSIDRGSALSSLAMTKPGNLSANPFNIVWDGMDADNSNGTLVVLNFTVPNVSGTFNVNVSYDYGDVVDGTLSPMNISTQNGLITIGNNGNEGGNGNPEQNDDTTISIDSVTAVSGGSIDVPVRITNNKGICGATISVGYDERLTLTKITKGTALPSLAMTTPGSLSANPARIVWDGMEQDESDGIIATLTFSVPNSAGKYNLTLSYDDGDIVNGALMPINPLLKNGCIQIGQSFEVRVTIAEQSVTLAGPNENGKIIVAFYSEKGNLLNVKTFDVTSIINADNVNNSAKAKVMWWNMFDGLSPVCSAQIVSIK